MAGGRNGKACMSVSCDKGPRIRFTMAAADCCSPFRLSMFARLRKTIALLGPLPVKLNPTTVNAPMMFLSRLVMASTARIALAVYSTEAPCGACTVTVSYTHLRAHETDSYLV